MIKKERISIKLCVKNDVEFVKKWITNMKLFTPESMKLGEYKKGKFVSYDEDILKTEMKKEVINQQYNILLKDASNSIGCLLKDNYDEFGILTAVFDYDIFKENENYVYSLINEIMSKIGVVGRVVSLEDSFWQNNIDLDVYEERNRSLEGIPLKEHPIFHGEQSVDVEQMPGYEEQIENVWFGATWKMWFNNEYYQFVSKEAIEGFEYCYSNERITETCKCITLYENVLDYDNIENRQKQWKFKETIDFQRVVKQFKVNPKNKKSPSIEILNEKCENGGIKQFKIYLDKNDSSVSKDKATKVKVVEYNQAGNVIYEAIEKFE